MNTYHVRTFGCQMNKHDSERIAGMLEEDLGLLQVDDIRAADVVVFNTCCVREKADERLRGQVSSLKSVKTGGRPDVIIAVGGCMAQRDGELLLRALPHVDVVFGTHTLHELPRLVEAAAASQRPAISIAPEGDSFASDLPTRRESPWHAWVPITVGCDNHCTYCIVPTVRGRERSRPFEDVVNEVTALVADGVVEVTLLGQNVNSFGRDLYGEPRFADLLLAVAATGVSWLRFVTSHPKDLSQDIIDAMASTPQVCHYLHLPMQSGSDRILHAMNRRYTGQDYTELVARLREAMPDLALSTDIIVGFPGEDDDDFDATMRVVESSHYVQAFTFIYSPREGTPAAAMTNPVPRELTQVRFDRLVEAVQASALEYSLSLVGTTQRILIEGPSPRDPLVWQGRTASNKVVHLRTTPDSEPPRPGSFVDVRIDTAQTWFLSGTLLV